MDKKESNKKKIRRKDRVRAKIQSAPGRPRLSIFRSNKYTYAQVIDDEKGKTIFSVSTMNVKGVKSKTAGEMGEEIAKKAKELGISSMVSDRGHYKYHGRVKSVVEGVRSGGIKI